MKSFALDVVALHCNSLSVCFSVCLIEQILVLFPLLFYLFLMKTNVDVIDCLYQPNTRPSFTRINAHPTTDTSPDYIHLNTWEKVLHFYFIFIYTHEYSPSSFSRKKCICNLISKFWGPENTEVKIRFSVCCALCVWSSCVALCCEILLQGIKGHFLWTSWMDFNKTGSKFMQQQQQRKKLSLKNNTMYSGKEK